MRRTIQASAVEDILRQFEWYVENGLPHIAGRFRAAVAESLDELVTMPVAGAPRYIATSHLAGLRTWPVKDFAAFRVYYLAHPDVVIVLPILHDKRDIGRIIEEEAIEDPGPH